jgi:hypothetical protein
MALSQRQSRSDAANGMGLAATLSGTMEVLLGGRFAELGR